MNQADLDLISLPVAVVPCPAAVICGTPPAQSANQDGFMPPGFSGRAGLTLMQMILDHVHVGVAVVGPQLRLVLSNRAALRECASHRMLRTEQDHLFLVPPRHPSDFGRALEAARSGRWSLVRLEHEGDRTMLAVVPLRPNEACEEASVLMVFGPCRPSSALAIQFYAQTCGMTSAEARVLRDVGDGLTPREIAQRHDVALSTVRTQLGSIRNKAGACSITDLVRTLGSLPPIMPAALGAV